MHPIDKEILRVLANSNVQLTPAAVAEIVGIHPQTAKEHIGELAKDKLVTITKRGTRWYCKSSLGMLKKLEEKR